MISGKRKKFNLEERVQAVQYFAKERDKYESEHLGGFRKIFVTSEEQFQEYRKFYEFAEELYIDRNRLLGAGSNYSSHYFLPFMRISKESKKREGSLYNSGVREEKALCSMRSIDNQRVTSAKSTSKRVLVSSSKHLQSEKQMETATHVYF
jgi:hypothetical protein